MRGNHERNKARGGLGRCVKGGFEVALTGSIVQRCDTHLLDSVSSNRVEVSGRVAKKNRQHAAVASAQHRLVKWGPSVVVPHLRRSVLCM
jgi:hypothetical protein